MEEQFRCGHCGGEIYKIYRIDQEEIKTVCEGCGIETGLVIHSRITERWLDKDNRGIMCTGWGSQKSVDK